MPHDIILKFSMILCWYLNSVHSSIIFHSFYIFTVCLNFIKWSYWQYLSINFFPDQLVATTPGKWSRKTSPAKDSTSVTLPTDTSKRNSSRDVSKIVINVPNSLQTTIGIRCKDETVNSTYMPSLDFCINTPMASMQPALSSMTIADFFAGKTVFITGGTGFMGKVLLEKLLRSCPGVSKIYLLIRPKKGQNAHERLSQLLCSPVSSKEVGDARTIELNLVKKPWDLKFWPLTYVTSFTLQVYQLKKLLILLATTSQNDSFQDLLMFKASLNLFALTKQVLDPITILICSIRAVRKPLQKAMTLLDSDVIRRNGAESLKTTFFTIYLSAVALFLRKDMFFVCIGFIYKFHLISKFSPHPYWNVAPKYTLHSVLTTPRKRSTQRHLSRESVIILSTITSNASWDELSSTQLTSCSFPPSNLICNGEIPQDISFNRWYTRHYSFTVGRR